MARQIKSEKHMFTIITGAQFGDEGKGKIVDMMASEYDVVARFQGGDNAGHTVVAEGKTYKLHLIPSGVLFQARLLIGPVTVMNPMILMEELAMLSDNGVEVPPSRLGIDAKTSIIMPYHVALDGLRESKRAVKIGTTNRGIGFAYVDKVGREEIQMADIADRNLFMQKLDEIAPQKESAIKEMGGDPKVVRSEIEKYLEIGKKLKPYITDVSKEINQALKAGKKVLAEGAQGTHLDINHRTQKFVTSSSTVAGSACAALGVGPTKVSEVMGVIKAYITRVGEGPLPTEQKTRQVITCVKKAANSGQQRDARGDVAGLTCPSQEKPSTSMDIHPWPCLLYTSDAADDLLCVDLGGRR